MIVRIDHPFWRRLFGALLVAYGLLGLLIVIGGAALVANSVARVDGIVSTIDTQRQVLVRSLDATETFLHDAHSGSTNVGSSLTAAVDSARQTADLTRSLATAMDQLSAASSISILGQQPFGGLGTTFGGVASQATSLGDSLDHTADALARNGTDLTQVSADLGNIETEITDLRGQVAAMNLGTDDVASIDRAIETSRLVLFGVLLWLALQALIAVLAGLVLLRWTPVTTAEITEEVTAAEEEGREGPGLQLDGMR